MEAALRKMDAMLASTVVAITNTLPGSANEGDLYLVGTSPTGVAAGWANRIARWRGSPAGWEAYQPMQGWIITIVGESTNKVRRYDGTAWVALATDAGAEPAIIDGTAAQYWSGLKSWTDFATSVRATVLTGLSLASSAVVAATDSVLVAIGKLQAQVSSKLPVNNPAFTGVLTGGSAALTGGVDAGGEIKSDALAGTGNRPLVAGADGTIDDQDAATFRGTIGAGTSSLALGETSATAYRGDRGKIAYDHAQIATGNPHGTTAADVGAMGSSNPNFTGILYQGWIQRIASDGTGWFRYLNSSELVGSTIRPLVVCADGLFVDQDAATFRGTISAAKAPSKLDVSASTTLGAIDASAIKVTTTDVNLTLSGGVNGQGWDIVCPTTSFGISIPTGVTLYAYAGSDIGPTTRAVGGGRGIRIVRIDAATWIAPNLTW